MSTSEFLIVFACCALTMLICRVAPLMLLKGKSLPASVERALGYIPPAAFGALVANDLFNVGMFAQGFWPASVPLVASVVVMFVAFKTKSLIVCVLAGVAAYALLLLI